MVMRKLLVATSAMFLASSAFGADLSGYYKAPPPAYAASDWSGFYIGVNGGGGWATTSNYSTDFIYDYTGNTYTTGDASGGVIGGHFGYNWEFYNSIVAGLEVDADAANIKNTTSGSYVPSSFADTGLFSLLARRSTLSPPSRPGRLARLELLLALRHGRLGVGKSLNKPEATRRHTLVVLSIAGPIHIHLAGSAMS